MFKDLLILVFLAFGSNRSFGELFVSSGTTWSDALRDQSCPNQIVKHSSTVPSMSSPLVIPLLIAASPCPELKVFQAPKESDLTKPC